jgi:hypothetical protein
LKDGVDTKAERLTTFCEELSAIKMLLCDKWVMTAVLGC